MKQDASILLVDDHPIFRQGLAAILGNEEDLTVVAEAGDGAIALDMVRAHTPDIVVMDINMPNLDGIQATRQIMQEFPETKIVALSVHSGKRFVRDMLQAGAAGYILKESVPKEMIEGIRSVLAGNVYLSASISGVVVSEYKALLSEQEQSTESAGEPLLRTKFYRPPVSSAIIPRMRLIEALEEGRQRAMTLITAPAGYGKSILASQWLSAGRGRSAWLSLDKGDNDLRLFVRYLLEAIRQLFPAIELHTSSLLQAVSLPPAKVLARYLLNDLEQLEEPFVLVLDDYHRISDTSIHELMAEILRYPSPLLHLVLLTRRDPSLLPLSHLRAQGRLSEITMEQLRFSVGETREFLERVLHVSIDEPTALALEHSMEGWVTGLCLAAMSLKGEGDQERLVKGLTESSYYVQEYLIDEVLSQQSSAFARSLMALSILDRFCAPLCELFRDPDDTTGDGEEALSGQSFIEDLEKLHLFVIALDETHEWFRYHHLFQKLLQQQLKQRRNPDDIVQLHSRAAVWFTEQGLIDEALTHAMIAGETDYAIHVFVQHRDEMMNNDQWDRLERWLRLFPLDVIEAAPLLLLTQAWIAEYGGDFLKAFTINSRVEALLSDIPPDSPDFGRVHGEYNCLLAAQQYVSVQRDLSLASAEKALTLLPVAAQNPRTYAVYAYAFSAQARGEAEKGLTLVHGEMNTSSSLTFSRMQLALCTVYFMEGDLFNVHHSAQKSLRMAGQHHFSESLGRSHYFLGTFHYIRNELPAAAASLQYVIEHRYNVRHSYYTFCVFTQALLLTAQGQERQAWDLLESVTGFAFEIENAALLNRCRAFKVELALRQGYTAEIEDLMKDVNFSPYPPIWFFFLPQVTELKALMALGRADRLEEAFEKSQQLVEFGRSNHNIPLQVQVLSVQALLFNVQGDDRRTFEALARALALGEPGGFIRTFVDLGAPMADLLQQALTRKISVNYVECILAAFNDDGAKRTLPQEKPLLPPPSSNEPARQAVLSEPSTTRSTRADDRAWIVDSLTDRELEVLQLLGRRLYNKEMAEEMALSPETIKTHLRNIYQKLDAKGRREAVIKARELGILPG